MSGLTLRNRIEAYQEASDYKLLPRVPLIITVNGRGFSKLTNLIEKPFSPEFAEAMASTALKLCNEISGAIFSYNFNDEIVIIVRNDQNIDTSPYFDNKLQKICSSTAAIATQHFDGAAVSLSLMGKGIFTSNVFVVPTLSEAVNTIIYKRQQNFYISVQAACTYELLKKHNKNTINEMLSGLSLDEKIDLLGQECQIDFNLLPIAFRRGRAIYRVPKLVGEVVKNKWHINSELPIFTKDPSFLNNLFKNNGVDIFNKDSF